MNEIEITAYSTVWPRLFTEERSTLLEVLPVKLRAIHHIGSTSVPGLSAKPIIDILIEVDDIRVLDAVSDRFESLAYTCMGEYGIPGRRFYWKGKTRRSHHIHAFESGSYGARRHLAFRDYLRSHPQTASEYGSLKKLVAKNCGGDINKYCDGKDAFVSEYQKIALLWWERD